MNETDTDQLQERKQIAYRLFRSSPLKQQKFEVLRALGGDFEGRRHLDIGSDNGVISLKLRELGGEWWSADLLPETVECIRSLVVERVCMIQNGAIPDLQGQLFDQVLIVDMLEHLENDSEFLDAIDDLLEADGALTINVPNPNEGLLRWFRKRIGQTDEVHGHVRPGYSLEQLQALVGDAYQLEASKEYSRFFSALVDTIINAAVDILGAAKGGKKGRVVTGDALLKAKRLLGAYTIVAPFLRLAVWLDEIFPITAPNMLAARFRKRTPEPS